MSGGGWRSCLAHVGGVAVSPPGPAQPLCAAAAELGGCSHLEEKEGGAGKTCLPSGLFRKPFGRQAALLTAVYSSCLRATAVLGCVSCGACRAINAAL